jgi:hypothetical protein
MEGSDIIETGTQTTPDGAGTDYSLASVILQPETQYDLIVTTLGVPVDYPVAEFSGTLGWGQIAVDVSAATPEPSTMPLLALGLVLGSMLRTQRAR